MDWFNDPERRQWMWLTAALLTFLAASFCFVEAAQGAEPAGMSIRNPDTGVTTTIVKNDDGTTTMTQTDRNGNEISRTTSGDRPDSVSSTDRNGNTTTIEDQGDGTRDRIVTDRDGNEVSREEVKDPEPTLSDCPNFPDHATARHADGSTTTAEDNGDGTRRILERDANGRATSRRLSGNEPVGGEQVDQNGLRTSVTGNPDGSRTIVITDRHGNVIHTETVGRPMVRVAPPVTVIESRPQVVVVEERRPRISVGVGFGFGTRRGCHTQPCHPRPSCGSHRGHSHGRVGLGIGFGF